MRISHSKTTAKSWYRKGLRVCKPPDPLGLPHGAARHSRCAVSTKRLSSHRCSSVWPHGSCRTTIPKAAVWPSHAHSRILDVQHQAHVWSATRAEPPPQSPSAPNSILCLCKSLWSRRLTKLQSAYGLSPREILGYPFDRLNPSEDFCHLGGTSLQVAYLINRIKKSLEIELRSTTLYENSSLGQLTLLVKMLKDGTAAQEATDELSIIAQDSSLSQTLQIASAPAIDWLDTAESRVFLTGATGFVECRNES